MLSLSGFAVRMCATKEKAPAAAATNASEDPQTYVPGGYAAVPVMVRRGG
jgi:hypothetical protein